MAADLDIERVEVRAALHWTLAFPRIVKMILLDSHWVFSQKEALKKKVDELDASLKNEQEEVRSSPNQTLSKYLFQKEILKKKMEEMNNAATEEVGICIHSHHPSLI